MEGLKIAGAVLLGIAGLAALLFVAFLLIEGTATVAATVLPFLSAASVIGTIFCVVVLIPLSIFRATRIVAVWGFFISSYLFGLDVWMYGFLVTYDLWGGAGVFVGLFLGGVGIVPLGIIAATLKGLWSLVGELVFAVVLTLGARGFAIFLAATIDDTAAAKAAIYDPAQVQELDEQSN